MNSHFKYLLKDEQALISMLLSKSKFGALVAGTYLKMNYNHALKTNKTPYFYCVSRYNGGSFNNAYVSRVRSNMRLIRNKL